MKGHLFFICFGSTSSSENNKASDADNLNGEREKIMNESRNSIVGRNQRSVDVYDTDKWTSGKVLNNCVTDNFMYMQTKEDDQRSHAYSKSYTRTSHSKWNWKDNRQKTINGNPACQPVGRSREYREQVGNCLTRSMIGIFQYDLHEFEEQTEQRSLIENSDNK
jgi:hypothetical protein